MIRTILLIVTGAVFLVLAGFFAYLNQDIVTLELAYGKADIPAWQAFMGMFFAGWLFGLICCGSVILGLMNQRRKLKKATEAVKHLLEIMSDSLAGGERIEIRGFGSFSLHYRAPRIGRNPKTGESVGLAGKYVPHFKPGKELRDRVNEGLKRNPVLAQETDGSAEA